MEFETPCMISFFSNPVYFYLVWLKNLKTLIGEWLLGPRRWPSIETTFKLLLDNYQQVYVVDFLVMTQRLRYTKSLDLFTFMFAGQSNL